MTNPIDWSVQNMARLLEREKKLGAARPRKLTEQEQVRRFLAGSEIQRVRSGEITPTQYHRMQRKMLHKVFNVEVG